MSTATKQKKIKKINSYKGWGEHFLKAFYYTTINTFHILVPAAESKAFQLLAQTQDVSQLTSADIDLLVSELEALLSRPTVSLVLGNVSVRIVSNLLGATPEKLSSSSNR